jgi:predicted ATPase/Tfp pilus assembly protein PilF
MTTSLGEAYRCLRDEHCTRIHTAIAAHGGYFVETAGDSFLVVFQSAAPALACAVAIQAALANPPLTATGVDGKSWTLQVRLGVHTADEEIQPKLETGRPSYAGHHDMNLAARIMGMAAAGQILVTDSTYRLVGGQTQAGWQAWPNRRLKGFDQPETVWERMWDGRSRGEPGLRWLPAWCRGEPNRYIPRLDLEQLVLGHFARPRSDGRMPRLVTVHGFGGMGKTRLAVECALQAVGLFDGVYFVRLDDRLPKVEALTEAIGTAFGWKGEAALPGNVLAALRERNVLVVLDNFETVDGDAVRDYIGRLVTETSHLRLLVTGREAVKLDDAEHLVNLDDPRNHMTAAEAHALFVERARQKRGPDWTPSAADEAAIRRILDLTDHIPLALELAAAWTKSRSLPEIAAGLAATPLGALTAVPPRHGLANSGERHRSLTRCLDWSYDLLAPPEQDAFARFGVFADTFTAPTAADVCELPDAQAKLDRPQDASLVRRLEVGGHSRHELNRFTRSYAAEKLTALPGAEAISRHYVARYRELAVANNDVNDLAKLAVLDAEWRNAVAAAERAEMLKDWSAVAAISEYLCDFLLLRGLWSERESLNQRAVAAARSARDQQMEGRALNNLGIVYQAQGRWAEAEAAYQQDLAICRQFGDRVGEGQTLNNLGIVYEAQGRWAEAEAAYQQSLAIRRQFGDRVGEGQTLNNLGGVCQVQGRWAEAEAAYQQSLAIWRQLGDRVGEGKTLGNLALLRKAQGDVPAALTLEREALKVLEMTQDEAAKQKARDLIAKWEGQR